MGGGKWVSGMDEKNMKYCNVWQRFQWRGVTGSRAPEKLVPCLNKQKRHGGYNWRKLMERKVIFVLILILLVYLHFLLIIFIFSLSFSFYLFALMFLSLFALTIFPLSISLVHFLYGTFFLSLCLVIFLSFSLFLLQEYSFDLNLFQKIKKETFRIIPSHK